MPDRHEVFQVVAPANTPKTTPLEVPMTFPPGEVEAVQVRIPDGHASTTGIQIAAAHGVVVPATPGAWFLGNDVERTFTPKRAPNSGAWSAFVYNLDNRAHYWQIIFDVQDIHTEHTQSLRIHQAVPVSAIHAAAHRQPVIRR